MSDPTQKFKWKLEEPLREAHAGAYALVMAAQGIPKTGSGSGVKK